MDIDMTSLGSRIKSRRKELGLTQTDIYKECGIASGALSQIENGTRTPSVILFYKLSQVLKCDIKWLITGSSFSENFEICEKEENLIKEFRKLSQNDQEELIEILHMKLRRVKRDSEITAKSSSSIDGMNNMVG